MYFLLLLLVHVVSAYGCQPGEFVTGFSYEIITSGTCDTWITSFDECEAAKGSLAIIDPYDVSSGSFTDAPRGCYIPSNSRVGFNTNTDSSVDCGSDGFTCICKVASCDPCAAGKYQDEVGRAGCKHCQPGKSSAAGSSACEGCATGKTEGILGACEDCAAGTYQDEEGTAWRQVVPRLSVVGNYIEGGRFLNYVTSTATTFDECSSVCLEKMQQDNNFDTMYYNDDDNICYCATNKQSSYKLIAPDKRCSGYTKPSGPQSGGYALFLDPSDPMADPDRAQECANRCEADGHKYFYLLTSWGGRCMCGYDSCKSAHVVWTGVVDTYAIQQTVPFEIMSASQSNPSADYPASNVLDGNSNTFSHTNSAANNWIQLNLQTGVRALSSVEITNRMDCCGDRLDEFRIEWQKNGESSWTSCGTYTYTESGTKRFACDVTSDSMDITAVRIIKTGTDFLHLATVNIYGGVVGLGEGFKQYQLVTNYPVITGVERTGCPPQTYTLGDFHGFAGDWWVGDGSDNRQLELTGGFSYEESDEYCTNLRMKQVDGPYGDYHTDAHNWWFDNWGVRHDDGTSGAKQNNIPECQGDCDNDDQCADGLVCFQRETSDGTNPVPGCNGAAQGGAADYCVSEFVLRNVDLDACKQRCDDEDCSAFRWKADGDNNCQIASDGCEARTVADSTGWKSYVLTLEDYTFPCRKYDPSTGAYIGTWSTYQADDGLAYSYQCKGCAPGYYGDETGRTTLSDCKQCAVGTYQSEVGKGSCTNCPNGYYNPDTGATAQTSCKLCPDGYATYGTAGVSCSACPTGRYSNTVSGKETYCDFCPLGKYADEEALATCKNCPSGFYSDELGSGICTGCEAGQYTATVTSSICQFCPKGEFQDETAKTDCKQCPDGWTTNGQTTQTSCAACAIGRYMGNSNGRENGCHLCYAGSYNDETGKAWCKDCPSGFDQEEKGKLECETAYNTHSSMVNIVYGGRKLKQFVYTDTTEHTAVFKTSFSDVTTERTPVSSRTLTPSKLCKHVTSSKYRFVTGSCSDEGYMDVLSCTGEIRVPGMYIDPNLLNSDCTYDSGKICEVIPAECGTNEHDCICKTESPVKLFNSSRDCLVCGGGTPVVITSAFKNTNDKCVCSDHVGSCDSESAGWVELGEREVTYGRVGNGLCEITLEMDLQSSGVQDRISECATSCEKPQYDGFGITGDSCMCTSLECSNRTQMHYETFIYNTRVEPDVNELMDVFDIGSTNLKCYKDVTHEEEVSCDWIRALKHFARGTSYRAGDCSHLVPGTDMTTQIPCSGHGFSSSGTCACDYAEEFDIRGSGVGLTFEAPNLRQTPFRGRSCQKLCPGYDMRSMDSVCSGHGLCTADGRCDCEQGWTGDACSLACELESGPLTCSGHGTCDERVQLHRFDIVEKLKNMTVCPADKIYLSTDRVVQVGNLVYYMKNELGGVQTYTYDLTSSLHVKRPVIIDDYYIQGTAYRKPYGTDFVYSTGADGERARVPFMPCQDTVEIVREGYNSSLVEVSRSDVIIDCDLKYGDDPSGYTIFCGMCTCEEASRTGNWTGYDCRTPSLGHYGEDARRQCPGMTSDKSPCHGGGTCNWGSVNGDGEETYTSAECYCGDVTDSATYATAPRNKDGDMMFHVFSFGVPVYQDSVEYISLKDGVLTETDRKCWYPVQYNADSKEDCRDYCTANYPSSCITMDGDQCYCCSSECSVVNEPNYITISSGLCTTATDPQAVYKTYDFVDPDDCEAAAQNLGNEYTGAVLQPGTGTAQQSWYYKAPCYKGDSYLFENPNWRQPMIGSYSTLVQCTQDEECVCVEVSSMAPGVAYDVSCEEGLAFPTKSVCEKLGGTFDSTCIKDGLPICVAEKSELTNYNPQDCSCRYGWTGRMCDKERMMCLFSGDESYEGDKCTCNTPDGFPNEKVSDQGCCPIGTYFQQKRYSSFSPLVDFKVFDNNVFYTEALLQACKPSLTTVAFQTENDRILAIQNYLASTDEYNLIEETECINPFTAQLYHAVERYFSSSSTEPSITFKRDGSVDIVGECLHHCRKMIRTDSQLPIRGFTLTGFSSHVISRSFGDKYCSVQSKSVRPFSGDTGANRNPGTTPEARLEQCNEACTGTSKLIDSDSRSQNTNFWEEFSPTAVTHFAIAISGSVGRCYCYATDVPDINGNCGDKKATHSNNYEVYEIIRHDAGCACETEPAYFIPIEKNADSKRFDIVYPYSDTFECFKDESGQVLKHKDTFGRVSLEEMTGVPKTITPVQKQIESETKLEGDLSMWDCYKECIDLKAHALTHTNSTCVCMEIKDINIETETTYIQINASDTNTGELMVKTLGRNYVISEVDGDDEADATEKCFKVCKRCPSFGVSAAENSNGLWDCYCNEFEVWVDPTGDTLLARDWAIGCAGPTNGEMTLWLATEIYTEANYAVYKTLNEIARITDRVAELAKQNYDLVYRCQHNEEFGRKTIPPLPEPDYGVDGYCVCKCTIPAGATTSPECDKCVQDHDCSHAWTNCDVGVGCTLSGKDPYNDFCKGKIYKTNIQTSFLFKNWRERDSLIAQNITLTESLPALEAYRDAKKAVWDGFNISGSRRLYVGDVSSGGGGYGTPGVTVKYNGLTYEACSGTPITVDKQGGNHNVYEGNTAIYAVASTTNIVDTAGLLNAPVGQMRTFHCSLHPTSTFYITCNVGSTNPPPVAATAEFFDGSIEQQWRPGKMYLTTPTVFELNSLPHEDTLIRVANGDDLLINPRVCNIESYLGYGNIPGPTCDCPIWEYHRLYENEGYERFGYGFCLPDTNKHTGKTLQQCKDLCTSDADCNAFAWINTNECILAENGCNDDGEWNTNEDAWNRYRWTVLESSRNRCCRTGERVAYTVPFDDTRANLHSCLQNCTQAGDVTARVDKRTQFECLCGDTEYTESECPVFDQNCDGSQYSVRTAATSATEQCSCSGSYMHRGDVISCPAGKYMPAESMCATACKSCPFGKFSDPGALECRECGAGKIQDTPTTCEDCTPGKYAVSGDTTCTECIGGKFSLSGSGACTLCPDGYSQASLGQSSCSQCSAGDYAVAGSLACSTCVPGKYTGGFGMSKCKDCVAGKYSKETGQSVETTCVSCPNGYYSSNSGSTSCSDCVAGKVTARVYSSNLNTRCYDCLAGFYQNQNNQNTCKDCPAGQYQDESTKTGCKTCPKGYYGPDPRARSCKECNHGQYASNNGRSSCTGCGNLYPGYKWVSNPTPHTSWDKSCDQIKPCSVNKWSLPKCYNTQFTGSSGPGYGDNYRKCCWDYNDDSCNWHAARYSGENNAKWITKGGSYTNNNLVKWCEPVDSGY